MCDTYNLEYNSDTDLSLIASGTVYMPDIAKYFNGSNHVAANRTYLRELMRRAKAAVGLTGVRGIVDDYGDTIEFRPYRLNTVLFITYMEGEEQ